jgi:hypothetical protein
MYFSLTDFKPPSTQTEKYLHGTPYKSNIYIIIDTVIHKHVVILVHVSVTLREVFNTEKYIAIDLQSNSDYYDTNIL